MELNYDKFNTFLLVCFEKNHLSLYYCEMKFHKLSFVVVFLLRIACVATCSVTLQIQVSSMYSQLLPLTKQNLYYSPSIQSKKLPVTPKSNAVVFKSSTKVHISRLGSRRCNLMSVMVYGGNVIAQEDKHDDEYYMRRCVDLAKKAIGCTSPNPMVGCVIVKDGVIVGEGFHPKAGQPHAEVFALRNAGDLAKGGVAYVSLEPCNHHGRTPPCTEALIKAKVRKVVVGMVDPNPIVASSGIKKLQDAGIEVIAGVEEELCKRLNEAYIHQMLTGKPFVTIRYSISVDGRLLNKVGEEAMELDGYYSKLLQEYDAIVLSPKSITETSILTSKQPGAKQPLKIVLSKRPDLEKNTSTELETSREGIQMVPFDKVRLTDILHACKTQGFCSVLVDLKENHADFEYMLKHGLEENLIQKLLVEVVPELAGGHESGLNFIDLKAKVKNLTSRISGKSVLLEGYL